MRFVSITFIVLAMIILFPQRAFSQSNDPCMVTVEWISVEYPQGNVGNDWTFIAKVNGQAKAVKTNLDPGESMLINHTFTAFEKGRKTTPKELPDTIFVVIAQAIERDPIVTGVDINFKIIGPTICEGVFPFHIELAVQEFPKGGQATVHFGFSVSLGC